MKRIDLDSAKHEIESLLKEGKTRAYICEKFDCKYGTLIRRLKEWKLDHLKNQGGKGNIDLESRKNISRYFNNEVHLSAYKMKLVLWRDGLKEKKCEICGITEWMGKPAPLELDHIDGNRFNNKLENLRVLCANCHSQTDTNSGKNVKLKRLAKEKVDSL